MVNVSGMNPALSPGVNHAFPLHPPPRRPCPDGRGLRGGAVVAPSTSARFKVRPFVVTDGVLYCDCCGDALPVGARAYTLVWASYCSKDCARDDLRERRRALGAGEA